MGAQTADLALEILAGKDPDTIAPQLSTAGAYRVDARQLKRWQLSDANLPAGTVVSFKEATLWDEHRYLILSVLGARPPISHPRICAHSKSQTPNSRKVARGKRRTDGIFRRIDKYRLVAI